MIQLERSRWLGPGDGVTGPAEAIRCSAERRRSRPASGPRAWAQDSPRCRRARRPGGPLQRCSKQSGLGAPAGEHQHGQTVALLATHVVLSASDWRARPPPARPTSGAGSSTPLASSESTAPSLSRRADLRAARHAPGAAWRCDRAALRPVGHHRTAEAHGRRTGGEHRRSPPSFDCPARARQSVLHSTASVSRGR